MKKIFAGAVMLVCSSCCLPFEPGRDSGNCNNGSNGSGSRCSSSEISPSARATTVAPSRLYAAMAAPSVFTLI